MINPQITYRGMAHSPAFDDRIRELAGKLEEFNPKITSCHVIVDESDRHKRKGKHFEVRVDVHVPGSEIVASQKDNEDPYVAATDAFHVVMRQLDEALDKRRGETKRHHGLGDAAILPELRESTEDGAAGSGPTANEAERGKESPSP